MNPRYLVDTNLILWGWHEPHRLSKRHRDLLATEAEFHASVATIWEISIKTSLGKLQTVANVVEALNSTGYRILPIRAEHAEAVRRMPLHHRDPFDRMLIAQAQFEGLILIASDEHFSAYDLTLA